MDCQDAQAAILRSFEKSLPDGGAGLRDHVAGCLECAAFEATHTDLDRRLGVMLAPPEMSPAFRTNLRRSIRGETRRAWSAALPETVHLATCGAATLVCAVVLPFEASLTLGIGAAVTAATYVLITTMQDALERADEPT